MCRFKFMFKYPETGPREGDGKKGGYEGGSGTLRQVKVGHERGIRDIMSLLLNLERIYKLLA